MEKLRKNINEVCVQIESLEDREKIMEYLKCVMSESQTCKNDVFPSHMSYERASMLEPGSRLDHRDQFGLFAKACVLQKRGTELKIRYEGWSYN